MRCAENAEGHCKSYPRCYGCNALIDGDGAKKSTNCPNCGAPIEAEKCPYCGTVILDFSVIQIGSPTYVKFKVNGEYIIARILIDDFNISINHEFAESIAVSPLAPKQCWVGTNVEIDLHAIAVMSLEDETLVKVVRPTNQHSERRNVWERRTSN